MSNKYEDLIKNARMNADCGEHMSPAEVTTLLNVVETTFAALAGEVYDLKHPGTYLPSKRETPATDAFLAEVRAQGVKSLSNAVQSVIAERQRQQSAEGWTSKHDDRHDNNELAFAASCYAFHSAAATWDFEDDGTPYGIHTAPKNWPWDSRWWKPTNPRRDLVKAGALILAEIERIDRQEAAQ
ncbi:hypothetical protein ACYA12_01600 [Klebsiella pneumoniae]